MLHVYIPRKKRNPHLCFHLKNFGKYKQDFANSVYLWEGDWVNLELGQRASYIFDFMYFYLNFLWFCYEWFVLREECYTLTWKKQILVFVGISITPHLFYSRNLLLVKNKHPPEEKFGNWTHQDLTSGSAFSCLLSCKLLNFFAFLISTKVLQCFIITLIVHIKKCKEIQQLTRQ